MIDTHFDPQNPLDALQIWLESYLNFEKTPKKDFFWLDTMEFLSAKFENPEKNFQSFHIAGSKGKGSVSTFIASILTEASIHCGLYTSPHLQSFSERITESHKVLDDKVYAKAYKKLSQTIDSILPKSYPNKREPSWFELVTLFSFLSFQEAGFPWAVFETGLGGRLDATNVLVPAASIITEIELEHQEYLGNTIEEIAREKAGIIKENIPVFSATKEKTAAKVFKTVAKKKNAPYFHLDNFLKKSEYSYQNNRMKIKASLPKIFEKPIEASLQLLGEYQVRNALLASLAVKTILPNISQKQIERGLEKAYIPARFQIFEKTDTLPLVIADGAHTAKSIAHCIKTLEAVFQDKGQNQSLKTNNPKQPQKPETFSKSFSLLFACAIDKNVESIAKLLVNSNLFANIFITKPGEIKQTDLSKVSFAFEKAQNSFSSVKNTDISFPITVIEDFNRAIQEAIEKAACKNKILLVTGSFYLVSALVNFLAKPSTSSSTSA